MIYLDNAATTPVRPEVLEAMLPYLKEEYGNPSGLYLTAVKAKEAVEKARKTIADTLGCEEEEIYFTSGGTESDNWAIKSAVQTAAEQKSEGSNEKEREGETERADLLKNCHIITTQIEHHAVLRTCQALEREASDKRSVECG